MMNFDDLKPVQTSYEAGTDIDSGAYNEVIASTTFTAAAIAVENTTDSVVKIAVGAAASEEDIPEYIAPGVAKIIHRAVPKGSRLSCRAVNSDATAGFLVVTLMA